MRNGDFFAFCTSLKPIELKAIGELSWVRHMAEGEILYNPGEAGNALFIVNRGVLEIVSQKRPNARRVNIGRGDLLGDVEVFANIRRTQLVRACEVASLQCFPRANFPELLRLVPSFFRYLCEQIAERIVRERDLAQEQQDELHLSGRISKFDLTTIHQTIMSSGQTGELSIKDDNGEPTGIFYFDFGRPCAGQFQHLTGEDAFWQLFLCDHLSGSFAFSVGEQPLTDWIQSGQIPQMGGDVLITALQYRDELDALKKGMPGVSDRLRARATEMKWSDDAPGLRPVAEQIWELLLRGPKTMNELYRAAMVCELKIYQVVAELLYTQQASFTSSTERFDRTASESPALPSKPEDNADAVLTEA
jgi:CRP-like cAMP-binding protein